MEEGLGKILHLLWAPAHLLRSKFMPIGIIYVSNKAQKINAVFMIYLWKTLKNWRYNTDLS
jgi:hypothetical protein